MCRVLHDCLALAEAIELTSIPHFTTFQKAAHRLLQGPQAKRLLDETVEQMLGRKPGIRTVAADSTGLEGTTASGYFMRRRAKAESAWKTMVYHHFPKLGLVCDTSNHFILAFQTSQGPRPDVDTFNHLLEQASRRARIRCVLADAGCDSDANHRFAREAKGLQTLFPPRHGRPTQKPATGRYRRLMQTRFNQTRYRQRCRVETTISMIKRRQGSVVRARTYWSRSRELALMVLTQNIMILWWDTVFYRAPGALF